MLRNNPLIYLALCLFVFACSQEEVNDQSTSIKAPEKTSKQAINDFAIQKLEEKGQFHWQDAPDHLVWSAIAHGNDIAVIGYQPAHFENINDKIHELDITTSTWRNIREDLIDFVLVETQKLFPDENITREELLMNQPLEMVIPAFDILIKHPSIYTALRQRADVRYVEPMNYDAHETSDRSEAGCGSANPNYGISSVDYSVTSPNAKIPWNFNLLNIPAAWNTSRGDNIGVALIDTGTSPNQSKLGSQFSSGESTGRYISRYGTYVDSWWWWASPDGPNDDCGHGTQMAGLIAAPKSSGGSSVGVANKANLIAYRGTDDVVINGSNEKNGVKDALVAAGQRSDVKIISMSIGDVFSSSKVADGVRYAHNRGKLIFAAAGTSLTWTSWWGVIFPANMSETVAVTGVKDGYPLVRCSTCHDGSAVDFIVPMQRRTDNSRTSLTLSMSGNTPNYVGGSSAATATTAGVAALVWATNTSQSRTQVLNRMKNAASIYPARHGDFGWGIIDAQYAVTH